MPMHALYTHTEAHTSHRHTQNSYTFSSVTVQKINKKKTSQGSLDVTHSSKETEHPRCPSAERQTRKVEHRYNNENLFSHKEN